MQQATPPPPSGPNPTVLDSPSSPPVRRPKCGVWKTVPAHVAKTVLPDKTTPKASSVRKGVVRTTGWLSCAKVVKPPHRRYPCHDCGFECDSVKNRDMHRGSRRCRERAGPQSAV